MKILFLAHRIPYPPNKGDKIRSYNEVRVLAARGHEIHLRAFADDPEDLEYQVELLRWCASVEVIPLRRWGRMLGAAAAALGGRSLSVGYYASRGMRKSVKRALAEHQFDAVFVYSSTMAQYVPPNLNSRTVADLVDIDSEKWRLYAERTAPPRSWAYRLDGRRLRRYEYEIVSRFAYTVVTTVREAALLDELDEFTRRARLRAITNGVDLEEFEPVQRAPSDSRLVFVGAMDYYANIEGVCWFVEEVLPLVRARDPQAEFFIVGSKPTEEVLRLAQHPGVKVTGFVRDIRPYLDSAAVCVVPLRIARGVQNKVLEAMASGKAIVATSEVAAGLRARHEEELLIADTPALFADAVLDILRDQALREQLGAQARLFVEREHDWTPLLQKLAGLVETVGARPKTSGRSGARTASL
jgi:sugar transferase (PEP-CTERM/EpsH1 system associated)